MVSPARAQNEADPRPAVEAPASTPAPVSAPVPPKKKEGHGLSISIGDEDEELRSKLTPDQLFKLELARAERPSGTLEDILVPVLVPAAFFLMVFGIVAITLWARARRNRLMHETVRLFAEKGQPLPPEIFRDERPIVKPKSDFRRGIFWTAVGLGVTGYFFLGHTHSAALGLIPLCIGLGYFFAWKLESPPKPGAGV